MHGTGAFASRSAIAGGGALHEVSVELARRLREDAAERLEADPADLRLEGGVVMPAGSPSHALAIGELVAGAEDPARFVFKATHDPPAVAYPYATHACVVEVDRGDRRDPDPALRRRRGLRPYPEPPDRRGPDARRRRAGDRRDDVRVASATTRPGSSSTRR